MNAGISTIKKQKHKYEALVPAVEQASRVLICLARSPLFMMSLTEICREVGIYKSKGYAILGTLQKFGFVHRHEEGKRYSLGPGLIGLSRSFLDKLNYRETLAPLLERLARETGTTTVFGITDGDNLFIVAKSQGRQDIDVTLRIGHQFPLTAGAHGKAIVAFMPEDEAKKLLKREKLFFHGGAAKLNRRKLEAELAECRRDGFAVDIGELNPGIHAIAAPVLGSQEKPIGSIFIVGTFPEARVAEFGPRVAASAREASYHFGADSARMYGAVAATAAGGRKKAVQ